MDIEETGSVLHAMTESAGVYRNFGFSGHANEHLCTMDTRDLPQTITAWELAQLLSMTLTFPRDFVNEKFAPVAHYFKDV